MINEDAFNENLELKTLKDINIALWDIVLRVDSSCKSGKSLERSDKIRVQHVYDELTRRFIAASSASSFRLLISDILPLLDQIQKNVVNTVIFDQLLEKTRKFGVC